MPAPQEPLSEHILGDTGSFAISEDSRSRHSSVQGPYREGMPDTSFPLYCAVQSLDDRCQIYNHSLLPMGNGYGFYRPGGNNARPDEHIGMGASLGDLGLIKGNGAFEYLLNIFRPLDRNFPGSLPRGFGESPPAPPLSSDEYTITENQFPAGTVLASEGINVSHESNSPLRVDFETRSAQQGAVLVLPRGASREELVNPSKIYPFVKQNVVYWYQLYNGTPDEDSIICIPNGAVYVVIGVDRASSWSTAVIPPPAPGEKAGKRLVSFKYREGNEKTPWEYGPRYIVQTKTEERTDGTFGAIFLRLMAVALSPRVWMDNISYIPPDSVRNYQILVAPMFEKKTPLLRRISRWNKRSRNKCVAGSRECAFHPSIPLLHIMLLMHPSAVVGIVTDSMWSSEMNKLPLTHSDFMEFLNRVFANFDIVNTDGIVTLVKKVQTVDKPKAHVPRVQYLTRRIATWLKSEPGTAQNAEITRNMYKVLGVKPII